MQKMKHILEKIERAIDCEIESILHFKNNLDKANLSQTIQIILESKGKVITTGVGKSGHIAQKIAATFSSTGTASFFLDPTAAAHGDLGMIQKQDIVLALGKSGSSEELIKILPTISQIGAKIISITENTSSPMAQMSNICIHMPVLKEACPLELAPTSSTTISSIIGDAIAVVLMELKNFQKENFAFYHPAGRLGKRLSLKIDMVMRKDKNCAKVFLHSTLKEVLSEMNKKFLGSTSVIDKEGKLQGIITDFDIRQLLEKHQMDKKISAQEIMNPKPSYFLVGENAYQVLLKMENRKKPISVAPIIDKEKIVKGMVSIHDLLQKGL